MLQKTLWSFLGRPRGVVQGYQLAVLDFVEVSLSLFTSEGPCFLGISQICAHHEKSQLASKGCLKGGRVGKLSRQGCLHRGTGSTGGRGVGEWEGRVGRRALRGRHADRAPLEPDGVHPAVHPMAACLVRSDAEIPFDCSFCELTILRELTHLAFLFDSPFLRINDQYSVCW